MTDARNRQPKGIPVGGQFDSNAHDGATGALAAGWQDSEPSSGHPRYERVVTNPAGTAQYRVWVADSGVNEGDVYVELTDLEDGRTGSFRSFAASVDEAAADVSPIRLHQAPPLLPNSAFSAPMSSLADFGKFPEDDEYVSGLVRDTLTRSERVRTAKPVDVANLRAGDMIDFTPIYEDESINETGADEVNALVAETELFTVESVEPRTERRADGSDVEGVLVVTKQTDFFFPKGYKVAIDGIDPESTED